MKTRSHMSQKQHYRSDVDFQEELNDIFKYISDKIPVGKISWFQVHYDLKILQILAQISDMGGEKTSFMYDVPEEILEIFSSTAIPEILVVNQPEKHPFGKEICKRANLFDWSALTANFQTQNSIYGFVLITVDGKDRYTEEHVRLFSRMKSSFQLIMDTFIAVHKKKIPHPTQKEPVKDKNEFFRQVTLRLCGHLDLQTGVSQCLQYLSRFMPADALFVRQLEPDLHSERVLAESFGIFHQHTEPIVPWSKRKKNSADRRGLPRIRIINQPEHSSSVKPYSAMYGEDWSSISMPLIDKETPVGVAVLGLEGRNRYKEEHLQLFALLHDPFVLALSNNIKHREVIRLKNIIEQEKKDLQEELHYPRADTIIGSSLGLKDVMKNARLIAEQDSPVLLSGETGVGKEIIANFIHQNSSRRKAPFIKVNCGAIPDTLVDSELFGHEKGAFTGADSRKKGRFERADGGTIFLDEIAELPLQAQVRMLRVLQNKIIERVGGTEAIPVDIRIIAATHSNLEAMVAAGRFREDLWFRLNVFPIHIPPLRSRKVDIPALVDHFINKKSRELKRHVKRSLSPDAMERLTSYEWPGNVRELENVIERELILSKSKILTFQDISPGQSNDRGGEDVMTEGTILSLDDLFTRHVKKVLSVCNGKINGPGGAAKILKINPSTLRNQMKKLGIHNG